MLVQDMPNKFNMTGITSETVRSALDVLVYSSQEASHSLLENLILVDLLIASWSWPISAYMRTYALHYLLTSIIQQEFFRHRSAYGLSTFGNEQSIHEIRKYIIQDAKTFNPELIGWSWLYYRFVRVEFNFSTLTFCQLTHIDGRTLRRYQTHAIHRLTLFLIKKELVAQECIRNLSLITITYGRGKSSFKAI